MKVAFCSIAGAVAASSSVVAASSVNRPWNLGQKAHIAGRQAAGATTTAAPSITSSAFNAFATNNLGVYYGHSEVSSDPSMYPLCTNADVDIVMMGFLRQFNGLNTLPTFDFGSSCQSDDVTSSGTDIDVVATSNTTTILCPELAANITTCQTYGKKVFISLGGSSSNITFNSSSEASDAAHILWDYFGAGTNTNISRPFGNLTIDGFDFDIEGTSTTYFDVFAESLQSLFNSSSTTRYISAAPLCANNTALPHGFYENTNFVWPRFYNAQACGLGGSGFNASLVAWHNYLEQIVSALGSAYPLLYIGGLSFDNDVSGYVAPDEFAREVLAIRPNVSSIFGGVSLWEGSDALVTTDASGNDFINVTKAALNDVSKKRSAGCGAIGRLPGVPVFVLLGMVWLILAL